MINLDLKLIQKSLHQLYYFNDLYIIYSLYFNLLFWLEQKDNEILDDEKFCFYF